METYACIYLVRYVASILRSHPVPISYARISILNTHSQWQWAVHMLIYWTCWNVINRKIITRDIFLDMWRNQHWFTAFFQCIYNATPATLTFIEYYCFWCISHVRLIRITNSCHLYMLIHITLKRHCWKFIMKKKTTTEKKEHTHSRTPKRQKTNKKTHIRSILVVIQFDVSTSL